MYPQVRIFLKIQNQLGSGTNIIKLGNVESDGPKLTIY